MIWVRGAPADFDTWADLGADGWTWEDVRPVYERIEQRDADGPGTVRLLTSFEPDAIHASLVAAAEECGIPLNEDYNGASQDGVSFMQYCIADGVRHGTAAAYIRPVEANANLEVVTGAVARRLLFEGTRLRRRGVVAGRPRRARAGRAGGPVRQGRSARRSSSSSRGSGRQTGCGRSGSTSSQTCRGWARTCTTTCSRP